MKTLSHVFIRNALFIVSALLLTARIASAQTVPIPVVTMHVPGPFATESGNPAVFEVDRQGPTNSTLNVYYQIGGTASNGVDYAQLSHFVTIPAGVRSASITINPLQDTNDEGTETVVLQLAPSPLMSPMTPVNFMIGYPSNGIAYIFDDDSGSNLPPVANVIAPPDGSVFYAPTNLLFMARAFDFDGSVSNVEFFAGTQDLGAGHVLVLDPPGVNGVVGPVYVLNWTSPPFGKFPITAVATDNDGASTTSAPVSIAVLPPPVTVQITGPTNGTTFIAPVDIPIMATATSSNADIVRVDFFANDHFIGTDAGTNLPQYSVVWSNTPPGFYYLHAIAVDSFGGKGISAPVRIAVIGTNKPPVSPIVSIYALDPIAVVGTNCLSSYSNSPVASNATFRAVTNTASFVVRRSGDTNSSLTVYYLIGGTASNGVDYVTLPGSVTIPVGARTARIVVNPLNEGGTECPETVVLTLQQQTNTPPPYLVGWPGRAEAVVIDCNFAPPATSVLCDGGFHFFFPPVTNAPYYRIECSMDMLHWLPVCTNVASQMGIHFTDPESPHFPNLYYRVVPQSNAPAVFP